MNIPDVLALMAAVGCTAAQRDEFVRLLTDSRRAKARDSGKRRQAVFRAKRNACNALHPLPSNADNALQALPPSRARVLYAQKEEDIPPPSLRSGAPKGATAEKRASRLTDAWEPKEHHLAFANSRGISASQVREAAFEFKNFWMGDGRRKLDWDRTFTNRLLEVARRLEAKAPSRPMGGRQADIDLIKWAMRTDDDPRPDTRHNTFEGPTIDAVATRVS